MKVRATSWLKVDPGTRPGLVLLTDPWMVQLEDDRWILVEAGFWCDGASIPAVARPWLSPLLLLAMGIAHDYAVRAGACIRSSDGSGESFTVATATALAVALAERAGVGWLRRRMIALALSVAAPSYWHARPMDWRPTSR